MPPGTLTGADIARTALQYAGAAYTYGGRADHPGDWDCSSFISYVLGHDLGMALPGGGRYGDPGYPPNAHGPVVVSWNGWAGATTIAPGSVRAGDLCIWPGLGPFGHVGIAVSGTDMISALDHADGTKRTGIFPSLHGQPLVVRRVTAAAAAGDMPTAETGSGSAGDLVAAALAGLTIPALMIAAITGIAIIGGTIAAAALMLTLARLGSRGT